MKKLLAKKLFSAIGSTLLVLGAFVSALAQTSGTKHQPEPVPPPAGLQLPPPPPATAIAATVNGQPIPELSVYRGLLREPPKNWPTARKEVLNYLIDNVLVDQYLIQLKITVDPKEVEERFQQIKEEAKKSGQNFAELLAKLQITEDGLRQELHGALRWDKFVLRQATDKVLLDYFQKNPAMFDGSQVLARHILVTAKDDAEGQAKIAALKKAILDQVAAAMASVPATADKAAQEKERAAALLKAFAAAAEKESACSSAKQGGAIPWFARVGDMVEPFARAAFALQPYQLSDAVKTEFGYHLILALDRKPGREAKFEEVKPFVQEVYAERLREAILAAYKPRAKIEIHAGK
ncbi:MAG: peptidylprolyl isomerase [Gemmataceae bacterium]|nr:peptidylprolyl isomerase [Gemmataceae bacterium]